MRELTIFSQVSSYPALFTTVDVAKKCQHMSSMEHWRDRNILIIDWKELKSQWGHNIFVSFPLVLRGYLNN